VGVEVELYTFLTLSPDRSEWSALGPGRFTPDKKRFWGPLNRMLGEPQGQSGHFVEDMMVL